MTKSSVNFGKRIWFVRLEFSYDVCTSAAVEYIDKDKHIKDFPEAF